MDKKLNKILKTFTQRIIELFPVEEIILYGSYARNDNTIESDIDIAIIIDEDDFDFLQKSSMLYKTVLEIDCRIEPVLLNKRYNRSGFIEHIKSYGITLYPVNLV